MGSMSGYPPGFCTRRRLFQASAAAGVVVTAGGVLVGCKATPPVAHAKIILRFRAFVPWDWNASGNNTPAQTQKLYYSATEPFRAANPGVDIQIVPYDGNTAAYETSVIAGNGPDISHGWHPAQQWAGGFMLDLSPYIKKDNLDVSVFNKAQLATFRPSGGALYALPMYLAPVALAVNEGLLDQRGLQYPPDTGSWTWREAATLWTAATAFSADPKKAIYGTNLLLGGLGATSGVLPTEFLMRGWGTSYFNQSGERCTLDSPQAIACTKFAYGLTRAHVNGQGSIFQFAQYATVGAFAETALQYAISWRGLKWRLYPLPIWPAGEATGANVDYYMINPESKHKDLAWTLLRWLSFEPAWQRTMIDMFLLPPALKAMYPEFVARVKSLAPDLKGRNLEVWSAQALSNLCFPKHSPLYDSTNVENAIAQTGTKIWNNQVSVTIGLAQVAKQVDSMEALAKAQAPTQAAARGKLLATIAALRTVTPSPSTSYPAPRAQGAGVAATSAKKWVLWDKATGTWTLVGDGTDIQGASDNAIFACTSSTVSEGEWVCRVVSMTNLTPPHLSPWVKIGLMARSDLSDSAAMVSVHLVGKAGIEWESRGVPGGVAAAADSMGGAPFGTLMKPLTAPHKNYIIKPVWLKLARKGLYWSSFASFDGKKWTSTGSNAFVAMGGSWVGLVATPVNSVFGGKGYIRAVIDRVSFTPTQMMQLGNQGIPPGAGAVPKNWATL